MFCTQLKRVDFVVCFGKNVPLYVETVTFDENFWQQILPRIEVFFKRAVVPELFTLRVQRGDKKKRKKPAILIATLYKKNITKHMNTCLMVS